MALSFEAFTLVTCLGQGVAAHRAALADCRSGLRPCRLPEVELDTMVGAVDGLADAALPDRLARFECRNHRLAWLGLQSDGFARRVAELRAAVGAERIGVFIGSSTAGIDRTELAYRHRRHTDGALPDWFDYRHTHNAFSPAHFVAEALGLDGLAVVIATACSSSAKAFAAADRHLAAGLCDYALVGGVDSLCLTTLYGFNALELVASGPCRPWDRRRRGISLAEGAGFALVARRPPGDAEGPMILGYGESSDAFHMSAPHPAGAGAAAAMRKAIAMAGLTPADVDQVNLHGTGTTANDLAEDRAILDVLGDAVPCRSTKGATGHTLGAAGIVEVLLMSLGMTAGLLPGMPTTLEPDPVLGARIGRWPEPHVSRRALSNSFGFGGSNCALLLGTGAT